MGAILVVSLLVLLTIGVPVAITMGLSVVLAVIFGSDFQLTAIITQMFSGVDSFPIMAIPLFLLAGSLMEVGGISDRLLRFANEVIGFLRAGMAMVIVFAAMLFASISGSGAAATAAVGSFTLPEMKRKGYNLDFTTALLASAGSLGPIIPPSTIAIIIGVVSGVSIGSLFIGGIIPGILIGLALMVVTQIIVRRDPNVKHEQQKFSFRRFWKAFIEALPALGTPIIILGGIMGGIFTATESAAIAVAYSVLVGLFVYKELKWSDFKKIVEDTVGRTSMVLLIIAVAKAFGWVITVEQIPQLITSFITSISSSKWVFLLLVNILFLMIGMFMESIAAILIMFPIILPVAVEFGVDPLHLGIIICVNLCVGMVTPPYGITLFTACSMTGRSITKVTKHVLPLIGVMVFVLLLVTFWPELALWLPNLLTN